MCFPYLFVVAVQLERHGCLMDSVLVSSSSGPGLRPGRDHCVLLLGRKLKFILSLVVSLSTQEYKLDTESNARSNPVME